MSARSVSVSCVLAAALSGASLMGQNMGPQTNTRRPWGGGQYDASRRSPNAAMWSIVAPSSVTTPNAPGGVEGTVSLNALSHRVPGKAIKEWERAQKARQRGDEDQALVYLKKAIEIDPEFVPALNNIAAMLLGSMRASEAIEYLRKCTELDPHAYMPYANLAIAHLMENNFADAEAAARRAMEVDRTGNRSRVIFGLTVVLQDKFTDEALTAVTRAKSEFPQAGLVAARIYAARGMRDEALTEVNEYLASGDLAGADVAKQWRGILTVSEPSATARAVNR